MLCLWQISLQQVLSCEPHLTLKHLNNTADNPQTEREKTGAGIHAEDAFFGLTENP